MVPPRSMPTSRTMRITSGSACLSSGDSLRFPGATTNGAITLHRRSQKATTLSPFTLVATEAQVIATLFRRRCRAVTMNDRRIETTVLMKPRHRASENSVHAAVVDPAPPDAVNTRVVRFRLALVILVDRQLLPLTTQIQDLQNVVEDRVKTQLRCWTAATDGEMRQDKLLELRQLQLRRNRLPALSLRHSGPPKNPALPD